MEVLSKGDPDRPREFVLMAYFFVKKDEVSS